MSIIATIEQLEAIYGQPNEASTVKVADRITPPYRTLIDASPFAALATCGPEGLDCSPRGELNGLVRIHDEKTLMMPDRRGNNRVDSLRNIVRDPRVALLFLIPGSGNTLRINGRAQVSVDPGLLASFRIDGKAPQDDHGVDTDDQGNGVVAEQRLYQLVRQGGGRQGFRNRVPRSGRPGLRVHLRLSEREPQPAA